VSISSVTNSDVFRAWQAMQRRSASAPSPETFAASSASDGTSGTGAASGDTPGEGPARGGTFPGVVQLATLPYDSIRVTLPSGVTVGVWHFGPSTDQATEDQMVQAVEHLANSLSLYSIDMGAVNPGDLGADAARSEATVAPPAEATPGTDAQPSQGTDEPADAFSIARVHLDLANGTSIEIRHAVKGSETASESEAAAERMAKAADELAAAFRAYAGTSSNTAARDTSSGQLPSGLTA
jgi:hypothetical protein